MAETNKSKTSAESRMAWENKTYKKYVLRFRLKEDKELLDYIEVLQEEFGLATTEIFRKALKEYMEFHQFD